MKNIKFIIPLFVIFLLSLPTLGATKVHSEKLPDGSTINWCRFEDGKVEYCTLQDSLKDLDRLHNPQKYMTNQQKKEQAKLDSYKAQTLKEFPIINKMNILKKTYEQELDKMQDKQYYGVSIDTQKAALLNFKIRLLKEFELSIVECSDDNTIMGYPSIQNKYEEALKAKDNKIITEDEFKEIEAKLKKESEVLEFYYNKIVSLNSLPNDTSIYHWLVTNHPTYNPVNKLKKRVIENAIDTYVPGDAKIKFNRIMNMMN